MTTTDHDRSITGNPIPAPASPDYGTLLAAFGILALLARVIIPYALHVQPGGPPTPVMTFAQAHAICASFIGAVAPACSGVNAEWLWLTLTGWAGGLMLAAGVVLIVRSRRASSS